CLFLWLVLVKRHHPLADVPADGPIYLLGPDLFICLLVALAVLARREAGSRGGKVGAGIARLARGLIYGGIVIFCVVSFQVARIYGEPLDMELLRSADDLMVFRRSIWAYVGPMPIALMVYGLLCVPVLGSLIARGLRDRRWLRTRGGLWSVCTILCVGLAVMQWVRLHAID